MTLRETSARRFGRRPLPAYPAIAIAGVALTVGACDPRTARPETGSVVQGSATAVADAGPTPEATAGGGDGRFAEDDLPLDMNVGCKGDCPSPYEMGAARKDAAQVQARADRCAGEHGVQRGAAILRATVVEGGRATDLRLESEEGSLNEPFRKCLTGLVAKAVFTAPEKGTTERLTHARFVIPRIK